MHKKLFISLSFLALMLFAGFSAAAEMVNINKASAAAIQQNLVGIGPIKAEAIISYRKKNGKFKSLDDLQNVTGLGPALIKKNKRYLSMTKGVVSGDDKAYATAKKQAGKSKATGTKKPAKKKSASRSDNKADKSTSKTVSKATAGKTDSKAKTSKTKSKASKSARKDCSASKKKTMSKAEKKACADKTKTKKKSTAKKTTKKKSPKKKKKSKPTS